MKQLLATLLILVVCTACNQQGNKVKLKQEIYDAEKSFEKKCAEEGIEEAFYFFASDSAVIKRQNDTLVIGRENIKHYYSNPAFKMASVTWTPDYIDVSDDGSMGYTFGKYLWKVWNNAGDTTEYKGVFHTVWKRESDGLWRYVWD